MNAIRYLFLLTSILFVNISCNQPPKEDIYKTTNKEYASRSEKWILKFPKLPELHDIKNKMGDVTFNVRSYRASMPGDEHFGLNMMNYPESILSSIPKEQIYRNSVNTLINNFPIDYTIDRFEDVTENNISSKRFEISAIHNRKQYPRVLGKIIISGNEVLSVIYIGKNEEKADEFLTSFKRF